MYLAQLKGFREQGPWGSQGSELWVPALVGPAVLVTCGQWPLVLGRGVGVRWIVLLMHLERPQEFVVGREKTGCDPQSQRTESGADGLGFDDKGCGVLHEAGGAVMGQVRSGGPGPPPKGAAPLFLLAMCLGEIRNLEEGPGSGPQGWRVGGDVGWGIPGPRVISGAPWGLLGERSQGPCWEYHSGAEHSWGKGGVDHTCGRGDGCWMEGDGQEGL